MIIKIPRFEKIGQAEPETLEDSGLCGQTRMVTLESTTQIMLICLSPANHVTLHYDSIFSVEW